MHTTFRNQETETLQDSFPAQLLWRRWFKQPTLGQEICDYTSFAFPLAHLGLPGNKPNLTRKVLERVNKRGSQLFSLLSVIAASDNKAWKAVVAKNAREGSHGTLLAKFHTLSFWYIFGQAPSPCVSLLYFMCSYPCAIHSGAGTLGTSFSLAAKGVMSLGRLLHASCFQHYSMDFPKGLCYQYNYSHFRGDITAAESLPVFLGIPHVNYIFTSGMHLSIYLSSFTLLSRTTLLKTYFKAHFKSSWLKSMPIWLFE